MIRRSVALALLLAIALFVAYVSERTGLLVDWRSATELAPRPLARGTLARTSMGRVFSDAHAARVAAMVREDRGRWARRNPLAWTLGAAAYLDGGTPRGYAAAIATNARMLARYGWVYDGVLAYLAARVPPGVTVALATDRAAAPFFHVFRAFRPPLAPVHRDCQHAAFPVRRGERMDTSRTFSATLAVELPAGGGGLYVVEAPPPLCSWLPKALRIAASGKVRISYRAGWLATHDGRSEHMIAPSPGRDDELRITMQLHGLFDRASRTWWIYG